MSKIKGKWIYIDSQSLDVDGDNLRVKPDVFVREDNKATEMQATGGVNDTHWMSPLKTKQAIDYYAPGIINIGTGAPIYRDQDGLDFRLRSLIGGTNISLDLSNNNEIRIDGDVALTYELKVSASDLFPNFLESKVSLASGKLTKTVQNPGGNESLYLNIGEDVFDKTVDTTDGITEGSVNLFYLDSRVNTFINTIRGVADGLASLDSTGKVPEAQLPSLALTQTYVVDNISERDLLEPDSGDIAIVLDASDDPEVISGSATYIYNGMGWQKLKAPDNLVQSVNTYTGTVVLDTDDIGEASNLYFTIQRARESISSGQNIIYNESTGEISSSLERVKTEYISLTSTHINNKFIDLVEIPRDAETVMVIPLGGPVQDYGVDFILTSDGLDNRRVSWDTLGLEGVLTSNDKLIINYAFND